MPPVLDLAQTVGYIAALCTTVAFLPQALKAWRSRSVGDLSLTTFTLLTVGVAGWLIYGIMTLDWPIIVANAVTLALASAILAMRVLFGGGGPAPPGG